MKKNLNAKDKLFIWRDMVIKLMMIQNEEAEVYVFMDKTTKVIINLYHSPECQYLDMERCLCYKTSLKKLYLHLIITEYPNTPRECLVIYSNRIIRRMSVKTAAKLLSISELEYQGIETGKVVKPDIEKIAYILNFKIEEFYYNFHTTFELIM